MTTLHLSALDGRFVRLEPLRSEHVAPIAEAGSGDRSSYGYTQVPDGRDEAADYVAWLLDDAANGHAAPFVQRRVVDQRVIGCTRFLNPAWPLGRTDPDEVEIGGTWLTPDAQRTPVNTEAKLLLLTYAFDVWRVQRVAICTDARNDTSRRAIERLGADLEGILRRHRRSTHPGDGDRLRDSATYSVTVDTWPSVRSRLVALLEG